MSGLPHEAYLACMAGLPQVGPSTLRQLAALGPPDQTWSRLCAGQVPLGVVPRHATGPEALRQAWERAAAQVDPSGHWSRLRELGIGVTSLGCPGYPTSLVDDPEAPVVMFHQGDPSLLEGTCVAIVGTRRPTGYGRRIAHQLGSALAAEGISVVSGLALGIDAAAHAGAVGAGAAPIAVVGAGLDAPCPQANRPLARRIAATGLICSEVPVGVRAAPWRFPVRNRIVAAFARVVVVVESAATGGSMSTVEHALRRSRTVLAVPGPIDAGTSAGTNRLIADGAGLCTGVDDVLASLGRSPSTAGVPSEVRRRSHPEGLAGVLLGLLGWRPETPDYLVHASGAGLREVIVALDWLTRHGWVTQQGGFVERLPVAPAPMVP